MVNQWQHILTLSWLYFESLCFHVKNLSCYRMKLKLNLKLLQAALTRMKCRHAVIMIKYTHFPFFMLLFIFSVGKEFWAGNNEATSAMASIHTVEIINILSGNQLNLMLTYWAVIVGLLKSLIVQIMTKASKLAHVLSIP